MDYSQGIQFETSIINMEEAKELTMNNQQKKSNKSGAGVAPSSPHELLQKIALWDLQLERPKIGLGMALSKSEAKKAAEDAAAEEERKCLTADVAGEGEKIR